MMLKSEYLYAILTANPIALETIQDLLEEGRGLQIRLNESLEKQALAIAENIELQKAYDLCRENLEGLVDLNDLIFKELQHLRRQAKETEDEIFFRDKLEQNQYNGTLQRCREILGMEETE